VEREPARLYDPTFWPAVGWAASGPWAVLLRQSTGARLGAGGEVELMVVRDAEQEACDNEGGTGSDLDPHRIEWRLAAAPSPVEAERAAQAFNRPIALRVLSGAPDASGDLPVEHALLRVWGDAVVTALKPADRGGGLIVRALLGPGPATIEPSPLLGAGAAEQVDLAERTLGPLDLTGGSIALDPAHLGSIATVRLR
jgi:hypothetical protein